MTSAQCTLGGHKALHCKALRWAASVQGTRLQLRKVLRGAVIVLCMTWYPDLQLAWWKELPTGSDLHGQVLQAPSSTVPQRVRRRLAAIKPHVLFCCLTMMTTGATGQVLAIATRHLAPPVPGSVIRSSHH